MQYLIQDQGDATGMTWMVNDDGVDWVSIINSRMLRVTGFELQHEGSSILVAGKTKASDTVYIKDRYTPGVGFTIPQNIHTETLNLSGSWTPNSAAVGAGAGVEEKAEDTEDLMEEDAEDT